MPRHRLLGDMAALPTALEVVEDFELQFRHDVVGVCLDSVPDDRVRLFQYSTFFYRESFEILRHPDDCSHTSWAISHIADDFGLKLEQGLWAAATKRKVIVRAGCSGKPYVV